MTASVLEHPMRFQSLKNFEKGGLMRIDLTDLSYQAFEPLLDPAMTGEHASDYLQSRLQIREFYPTLFKMYPNEDLMEKLFFAFTQAKPTLSQSSVSRNLRNWANKKTIPQNREDIFIIGFALHFSEAQTSYLLGFISDYGIHYREPRELVFAYCLRVGKTYLEALDFMKRLPSLPPLKKLPEAGLETLRTQTIIDRFSGIQDDASFIQEFQNNLTNFGILHLRAYDYFIKSFEHLKNPYPAFDPASPDLKVEEYSIERVMEDYLTLHMPVCKKRSNYSLLQKMLKADWPNATSLTNILNHKKDVPRKLLLLLYIVTEGILNDDYDELDEEYFSAEQRLDEHWWRINLILNECGMNELDPRNAYDWLVLYSLNTDDTIAMDEKMELVIQNLFPEDAPTNDAPTK